MVRIFDTKREASPIHDDYEPSAEWLGGEAWVNPVPAFFGGCERTSDSRAEPAASDWIPV